MKTPFDEYGNYKSRHIPDPVVILEPTSNVDVDILWMMTPRT
jgi:hypothetical protein